MLVYRGMDIATAKPTPQERAEVRYFGIDLAEPSQAFSVADYRTAVVAQLRGASPPLRRLLVVGGTGLYIKALTHGLDQGPAPDLERRSIWEAMARSGGPGVLREELARRAPAWLAAMPDQDNPRRLMRALEWSAAGYAAPPRSWQRQLPAPLLGLRMDPAELHRRIDQRIALMVREGLWEETARLAATDALGCTARQAIGYAEALDFLAGRATEAAAIARIAVRTRQLSKRQMTWWRRQAWVEWIGLDLQMPMDDIIDAVAEAWSSYGPIPIDLS